MPCLRSVGNGSPGPFGHRLLRFVVGAQLPPALARAIQGAGHQAEHVRDIELLNSDDLAIWQYAAANDAAIVTKDEDFVSLHSRGDGKVAIIWLRRGNASRRALLQWLMPLLAQTVELIQSGETLIEIR